MNGRWVFPILAAAALLGATGCEEELTVARGAARLVVDPAEIDFEDSAVGVSYPAMIELHNAGSVALDITKASLSAELEGEFTLSQVPKALAPNGKQIITLTFLPTTPGLREGVLTFMTDSESTPQVDVPVRGRGIEPALIAQPPSIDFGRVLVGRTETTTVALTNRSDRPLTVIRASREGGAPVEFTVDVARTELMPGQSVNMVVTYAPVDVGPDQTTIVVLDSSPRAQALAIPTRGEGVDTDIVVEPLSLVFTNLYVGQSQTLPFFIRNIGLDDHPITELVFVSSNTQSTVELALDPATTPAMPFVLAAGTAQQIDVVYSPVDVTLDMDQVRVQSPGMPGPVTVAIAGSAEPAPVPRIEVMPTLLNFGQVEVMQSRPLNLTIGNTGTADLTLTGTITVQPAGAPYTLTGAPASGARLRPMDSSTFQVRFAPTSPGLAAAAEVVIVSNDPQMPTVRIPLTGEGTVIAVPSIFVDPNPLAFGAVPRGTRASRSVLVRNDGTAPLILPLVRLTDNGGGRFTVPMPPAVNAMLAPGASLTFAVEYFDNGVVATYNGNLEIQSNDPAGPVQVPLSATTDPPPPALTDIAVTLTWSSMSSDMDLHLIRPGGSFFDRPDDCCFCNPNPDWGVPMQPQDNPFLDRDDLFGPGPENINLSVAENGQYQVVIHHYSDRGAGPVAVNVQVRIRGQLAGTVTRTIATGERWIAGYVNWNATTQMGTFTPGVLSPFPTIFVACF